ARVARVARTTGAMLQRAAVGFWVDDCLGLAAQLAYYFFLALFPTLLFLLALASFFPIERLVPDLVDAVGPFVPDDVLRILRDQIVKISEGKHGGILTLGLLIALWTSSAAMAGMIEALNRAHNVQEGRSWWRVRGLAVVLTVALAAFVLMSFALVLAGPELPGRLNARWAGNPAVAWAWEVIRWPLALALVGTAIGAVYYFAPDVQSRVVHLVPGALVATAIWVAASVAFKHYILSFGTYTETYGAIGGVMVVLLWLYITGLAILAGAELNAEIERAALAGRAEAEGPQPVARAEGGLAGGPSPGRRVAPTPDAIAVRGAEVPRHGLATPAPQTDVAAASRPISWHALAWCVLVWFLARRPSRVRNAPKPSAREPL
ncbi:MAG TPA: YihY/virulence factor BrkB family protein, partial [Candidatus Binatia bacterium]|nr:YihY/virulence factor BrkB family protein [Candidatus Binatia bacterium]